MTVTTPEASPPSFTRADYMDHKCSHEQYYAQYVTLGVLGIVKARIGEQPIVNSQNQHFNDIPLKQWDLLHDSIKGLCSGIQRRLNPIEGRPLAYSFSLSDTGCIAKEAARQIKMEALGYSPLPPSNDARNLVQTLTQADDEAKQAHAAKMARRPAGA